MCPKFNNFLENNSDVLPYSPSTKPWHNLRYRPDIGHFVTRALYLKDPEVCIELYMAGQFAEELFRKLQEHKEEIEKSFGEPLIWDEVEGRKARKILIRRTWDFRDKDTWPDLFEWFEKNIQALKAALEPIVSNF